MPKNILLAISITTFIMYLKKQFQNGKDMQGFLKFNPEKIIDTITPLLDLNPLTNQILKTTAKGFINGISSDEKPTINAKYKRIY